MKPVVLFVDDEPNVLEGLKRSLRKERFEFMSANNADEALALLETQHIDVVVSDEIMPGMRGSELLGLVEQRYPSVIRVMLTGSVSFSDRLGQRHEGPIHYYISKPTSAPDVARLVNAELQNRDSKSA